MNTQYINLTSFTYPAIPLVSYSVFVSSMCRMAFCLLFSIPDPDHVNTSTNKNPFFEDLI